MKNNKTLFFNIFKKELQFFLKIIGLLNFKNNIIYVLIIFNFKKLFLTNIFLIFKNIILKTLSNTLNFKNNISIPNLSFSPLTNFKCQNNLWFDKFQRNKFDQICSGSITWWIGVSSIHYMIKSNLIDLIQ